MSEIIIGIDLGTTNSEVAVVEGEKVTVIADGDKRILPSFVGLDEQGEILVGEPARNQYAVYPERTIKSIKRRMGSDDQMQLGEQSYSPQEISAIILRRLKAIAEAYLGHAVSKAVITVPAYFNDAQRQATREAGEIAGLEVVRIINEPTAAALAYEGDHHDARHVLVYDLGGGTFDVSVVRIQQGVVEVIASHGNNHLGGDDFDQLVVEALLKEADNSLKVDLREDRRAVARLNRAAEAAKRTLSDAPNAPIEEAYLAERDNNPLNLDFELSRESFEEMIAERVEETLEAVHAALRDGGLTVSQIDEVLLVGGSTRIPYIQDRLEEVLGRRPRSDIHPDLCVAMGAALQGAMIAGSTVPSILVDVTPYTFGTQVVGEIEGMFTRDQYVPIIHRNTAIPVTKEEEFYTMTPGQQQVEVNIYQGEAHFASHNTLIGQFRVEGLDERAPANSPVLLRLNLDLNGVLQVTAKEKNTGLEKSLSIDNAFARIEATQLAEARSRLDALFGSEVPLVSGVEGSEGELIEGELDDSHERHVGVQAEALIEKAERLMESASTDDREELIDLVEAIREQLEQKRWGELKEPMDQLADLIYYLEG